MPERRTNYFARVAALLALGLAFVLVVATIATSGGDSDGDGEAGGDQAGEATGLTREGERALEEGVWIVDEGDTLVSISEATGIDLDELVELNADIDPQALIAGQRISLRTGQAGEGSESGTDTDTNGDPADEFGDGSVDGDNSSAGDGVSE